MVQSKRVRANKAQKAVKSKEESIQVLQEQYLQAKASGDTKIMKMLESILKRLGAKVPKL